MVLVNKLGTETWVKGNHTDNTGQGISGTIYTESKMVNVKNLTGYTLIIRMYDQNLNEVYSNDVVIVTAADGTWELLPDVGSLGFDFIGEVEIELTKSDEEITAIGVNGSSRLRIR